jgi:hypothetical protein
MNQTQVTPDHLSVSGIRELFRCGLKWYYEQIQSQRLPGAQSGPQSRGIALDKAAAAHFKQKAKDGIGFNKKDFLDYSMEEIDSARDLTVWDDGMSFRDVQLLAKMQALSYWQTFAQQFQPRSVEDVQKEVSVLFPGMRIPVVGVVDLILEDGTIVDNKVTKRVPNIWQLQDNWQLSTYALLTGEMNVALAIVVDLDKKGRTEYLESYRNEYQINTMLNRFRMAEQIILKQILMPAPEDSWYCNAKWCRHWGICEFGANKLEAS